jgi:hypothetical protein
MQPDEIESEAAIQAREAPHSRVGGIYSEPHAFGRSQPGERWIRGRDLAVGRDARSFRQRPCCRHRRCLASRFASRSLGSAVSSAAANADATNGFTPT